MPTTINWAERHLQAVLLIGADHDNSSLRKREPVLVAIVGKVLSGLAKITYTERTRVKPMRASLTIAGEKV